MTYRMVNIWRNEPETEITLYVSTEAEPITELARFPVNPLSMQLLCTSLIHLGGLMMVDEIDLDIPATDGVMLLKAARLFKDAPLLVQIVNLLEGLEN